MLRRLLDRFFPVVDDRCQFCKTGNRECVWKRYLEMKGYEAPSRKRVFRAW